MSRLMRASFVCALVAAGGGPNGRSCHSVAKRRYLAMLADLGNYLYGFVTCGLLGMPFDSPSICCQ